MDAFWMHNWMHFWMQFNFSWGHDYLRKNEYFTGLCPVYHLW
ncbi:hypothetical protein [Paraclostridium sordellii]|nr:hypothetical protein [Paeniclostridium sordellii]